MEEICRLAPVIPVLIIEDPQVAAPLAEALAAAERGPKTPKFFPAEGNGGVKVLKAWRSPLSDLQFCPTGGIGPESAQDYLALANVLCIGGSWVAPLGAIKDRDWSRITRLARRAASLTG